MASDSSDDDLVRADRSVEDWIPKLDDPDPMQRLLAVHALAQFGPRAAGVTDALTAALRDEDMMVRCGAAVTLGKFGNEAGEEVIFGLAETLRDPEDRVRGAAAEALVAIGPEYLGLRDSLEDALRDNLVRVRVAAARVLWSNDRDAATAVPVLEEALADPDPLGRAK